MQKFSLLAVRQNSRLCCIAEWRQSYFIRLPIQKANSSFSSSMATPTGRPHIASRSVFVLPYRVRTAPLHFRYYLLLKFAKVFNMVQHWRAAGMTYLKYSNTCADLVRRVLKDSVKSHAKKPAEYSMARSEWDAGKVVKRSK